MTFRQYSTFQLHAPDVATFSQATWNTFNGQPLFSTIIQRSILSYHFSPFFALLAPLFWIWADIRVLFVAQTIGLAAAGLALYAMMRTVSPKWAPLFLLIFYLNPALHEVAFHELRRVIFATPFIALSMYALRTKRYRMLSVALFFAILTKEDISIIVFMVGLFLMAFRREWKWGGAIAAVGLAWALIVPFCAIPSFHPQAEGWACTANYPQLNYFGGWNESATFAEGNEDASDEVGGIISNVLGSPLAVIQHVFDPGGLAALWRIFLPVALIVPFLGFDWLLLAAPTVGLMMLSSRETLHQMEDWYLAPVLPILFAATIVGIGRIPATRQKYVMWALLICTLVGYGVYSYAPLGGNYIDVRYEKIPHHAAAAQLLEQIPPDAAVAAQDAFVSHLTLRSNLYLYPWYKTDKDPVDYIVLDRNSRHYPFDQLGIGYEIDNLIADPNIVVVEEVDGAFLFGTNSPHNPAVQLDRIAEDSIRLDRIEVASANATGFFETANPAEMPDRLDVTPGQIIRVTVYWEAMAKPVGERTVSVRIAHQNGLLVAQQDSQPSQGARPTSWWEPGWAFRDVYYLEINPAADWGPAELEILLYDSFDQTPVPFGPDQKLTILPLQLGPPAPQQ